MMGPEQLGRLVDGHAGALVLYARQWCAAPEDVVQEAFVKLAGQNPAPRRPVPWLYRVVRNEAISACRADRRRRRHEAEAAARTPPWFISTEKSVDLDTATQALQAIPIDQREIIVAHIWGGLTFEDIAESTGTSSSRAHRLYVAGLSAMRQVLGVPCHNPSIRT
jgi:RNA polymerase sigma-70 factor (ECF subfamily)